MLINAAASQENHSNSNEPGGQELTECGSGSIGEDNGVKEGIKKSSNLSYSKEKQSSNKNNEPMEQDDQVYTLELKLQYLNEEITLEEGVDKAANLIQEFLRSKLIKNIRNLLRKPSLAINCEGNMYQNPNTYIIQTGC